MAACNNPPEFCRLSPELLALILSKLPVKSVLNVSETCKHLNKITFGCDVLWKRLCQLHFEVDLQVKLPSMSYGQVYQLIYKYRVILQNHTYGNYIPEYFYHWSLLLGVERLFFSGFRYLINSRFKKTWDISKSDVEKIGGDYNCIHASIRALKAKHNTEQDFQKVLLQRCMRNQKKICQHFVTASVHNRVSKLSLFIRDNPECKSILMSKLPIPKFLCDFDDLEAITDASFDTLPREIAFDFIKGRFHKSGFAQVRNYVKFTLMLQKKFSSVKSLAREVPIIATKIYNKLRNCVELRLIKSEEYMENANEYFDRLDEIEYWQREIKEKSKFYFNTNGLTDHEAYHAYIMYGDVSDLVSLQKHYEGLHNIRIWLIKNYWIEELLGATLQQILSGKPCDVFIRKIHEEIHKLMARYLVSGQNKHFRKLIRKIYMYATNTVESKTKFLEQLREELNNRNVLPSNDWLQEETSSDTISPK